MMLLHRSIFATLLHVLVVSGLTLPLTSPNKTSSLSLPSQFTVNSPFWYCADPSPALRPTTFHDCYALAQTFKFMFPAFSATDEVLVSPRSVADIQLPFHLRWGTCLMDLRGLERDSWDIVSMSLLLLAITDLATTWVFYFLFIDLLHIELSRLEFTLCGPGYVISRRSGRQSHCNS